MTALFLLSEHFSIACHQPIGRDSAIPNERKHPSYLKETSIEVFSLSIEMRFVDIIISAVVGDFQELHFLASLESLKETLHDADGVLTIYSPSAHRL